MRSSRFTVVSLLLFLSSTFATASEDDVRRQLEGELDALAKLPAPRLLVDFVLPSVADGELVSLDVLLDGRPLGVVDPRVSPSKRRQRVFVGQTQPGPHVVVSRATFRFTGPGPTHGHQWLAASALTFSSQRGLEHSVLTRIEWEPASADEPLRLISHLTPRALISRKDRVLLAAVPTASGPEPIERQRPRPTPGWMLRPAAKLREGDGTMSLTAGMVRVQVGRFRPDLDFKPYPGAPAGHLLPPVLGLDGALLLALALALLGGYLLWGDRLARLRPRVARTRGSRPPAPPPALPANFPPAPVHAR